MVFNWFHLAIIVFMVGALLFAAPPMLLAVLVGQLVSAWLLLKELGGVIGKAIGIYVQIMTEQNLQILKQ